MMSEPMLYLLHGMKRSDNHAIANWLLPQLACSHLNNAIPIGPILRGHPAPAPVRFEDWRDDRERRQGKRLTRLLVTLEDHELRTQPFAAVDTPVCRLLVLRRPDQLFSSRLRKAFRVDMPAYPRSRDAVMDRAIAVWKQHARCFLGDQSDYPRRIAILFDVWSSDRDYRAAISSALGTTFDDSGFGRVSDEGGGSSFDGTRFDGRAYLMAVTDRVSALDSHERDLLREIFRDPELQELDRALREADPYAQLSLSAASQPHPG